VGAVEGGGAFVALDGVFFLCGYVVRVAVRWAAEDYDRFLAFGEGVRFGGVSDGGFPAATGHGGGFAGGDYDDQLADAEELDVYDVGGPEVGVCRLAHVEEDGLGLVAGDLGFVGLVDEATDDGPERIGIGRAGPVLFEIECARPIGGPCGE